MPLGYDPMGGNRFSEKHALGLDPAIMLKQRDARCAPRTG
jgi:hypothetical protein